MRFNVFQVSRKGGREKNEDRMGYCYTRDAGLFCLADGMGGHPEGEVASQMALQTLAALFQREAKPRLLNPQRYLTDGVLIAHQQLLQYARSKKLSDTPRTTVVAAVMQGEYCYWAHCGDSRLYLVRQGKLIARTRDHSYIELQEALLRQGGSQVEGVDRFNRNVLFTCLGSPGKPMVDCQGPLQLERGDRLLLCSDGLWGMVGDEEITARLSSLPLPESVPDLVEEALRKGGPRCDNVSVVAVEWEGEGLPEGDSAQELEESGFATTIQGGSEHLEGLDDAEIEREVREINEAIHRTRK
ncbi:MAG: serine/threonine-protein phosphatase [Paucibacter sp.]|nr:serine/threonine-protein phosphatase [Roseateles sp.]